MIGADQWTGWFQYGAAGLIRSSFKDARAELRNDGEGEEEKGGEGGGPTNRPRRSHCVLSHRKSTSRGTVGPIPGTPRNILGLNGPL